MFQLDAQEKSVYISPDFEDVQPIWTHLNFDSTIIDLIIDSSAFYSYDGYTHIVSSRDPELEPLFYNGQLILVSHTMVSGDFAGGIVESIDLETGEQLWQSTFDSRNGASPEHILRSLIVADTLELYNLVLEDDMVFASAISGSEKGWLKIRKYDLKSGQLISETIPDTIGQHKIRVPIRDVQLHIIADELIEILELRQDNKYGYKILIDTLDNDGYKVNPTDTFSQRLQLDWGVTSLQRFEKFKKDLNGDIYFVNIFDPPLGHPEPKQVQLLRRQKDGTREELNWSIAEIDGLERMSIKLITDRQIVFRATLLNGMSRAVFVNKFSGETEREVELGDFAKGNSTEQWLLIDDELLLTGLYSGEPNIAAVYKSTGSSMEFTSKFTFSAFDYVMQLDDIYPLDGSDHLVTFSYSKPPGSSNSLSVNAFSAIMRVTKEQLGLLSSVADLGPNGSSLLKVCPNPFVESVTIKMENEKIWNGVLCNIQGRVLDTFTLEGGVYKLDMLDYPSGPYILRLDSARDIQSVKLFKF